MEENSPPTHFDFKMEGAHSTLSSHQRDKRMELQAELDRRIEELESMKDGWDGPRSRRPLPTALESVSELGGEILNQPHDRLPHVLNLSAGRDGTICFTLFGTDGREVELWLEDTPRTVEVLAIDGDDEIEVSLPITEFSRIASWLHGESPSI